MRKRWLFLGVCRPSCQEELASSSCLAPVCSWARWPPNPRKRTCLDYEKRSSCSPPCHHIAAQPPCRFLRSSLTQPVEQSGMCLRNPGCTRTLSRPGTSCATYPSPVSVAGHTSPTSTNSSAFYPTISCGTKGCRPDSSLLSLSCLRVFCDCYCEVALRQKGHTFFNCLESSAWQPSGTWFDELFLIRGEGLRHGKPALSYHLVHKYLLSWT